uniref:Large ribosomal subunit protein eL31 n=1 Tax=uncultured korarchaeote TaxID=161241 RepID=A0A1L2JTC6_9CREN|nr:ribosomal protein L31E [uncultured korarchaeote]
MKDKKEKTREVELTIPLKIVRRKKPSWKRSEKAVKFLREFIKRNFKEYEVKISPEVSNYIWSRGNENPPRKIVVAVISDEEEKTALVKLPESD